MPGRHWLLKTLRIDHRIAHSDLTTAPKRKMKRDEVLPLQMETILRLQDHDKGAVSGDLNPAFSLALGVGGQALAVVPITKPIRKYESTQCRM
jgi:hypothetical protein